MRGVRQTICYKVFVLYVHTALNRRIDSGRGGERLIPPPLIPSFLSFFLGSFSLAKVRNLLSIVYSLFLLSFESSGNHPKNVMHLSLPFSLSSSSFPSSVRLPSSYFSPFLSIPKERHLEMGRRTFPPHMMSLEHPFISHFSSISFCSSSLFPSPQRCC